MSKFTPGPWTLEYFDEFDEELLVGPEWNIIEVDNGIYGIKFDNKADAKLIAKAPEMYGVLTEVQGIFEELGWAHNGSDSRRFTTKIYREIVNLLKEIDEE